MPNNGYFDLKRDNELIAADTHFWCEGCLIARPLDDQSSDLRYCLGCYDFLLKEAEMLRAKSGRPEWIPKAREISKEVAGVAEHTPQIMSTVASKKIEVDIIRPRVGKRGPKKMQLPEDRIKEMSKAGMGSKAIARRLKAEFGIHISYKTIQRLLGGQR